MLIGQVLRFLPAQLLAPLAQLASVVLWTHWLPPSQMATFTLVSVAQEMAYAVGLSWFSIYALRYVPASGPPLQRFLATENAVVLGSSALALLFGLLLTATLPHGTHTLRDGLIIGLFFATRAINAHYAERARAQAAFAAYTVLQTCGPVGAIALGLLALQWFPPDAFVLLGAYAVTQALGALLALPLLRMQWTLRPPDRALLREAFRFGAPVLGLVVLGWVAENYIRYQVQWLAGAAALGLMIVGWSLGRRCAAVAAMLVATAAFPLASRLLNEGRRDEALTQLRHNALLVLGVLAPVTAALWLLGPALLALSVGHEYREMSAALLGWSALGGALRNLHVHVTDQLMVLDRRIGMLARLDLVEIGACALLSLLGLQLDGLRGALIGQAAGSLLAWMLSVHWAQRDLGLRWPWMASLRVLLATAVMGGVVAAAMAQGHFRDGVAALAGGAAAAALVYVLALLALFPREAAAGLRQARQWRRSALHSHWAPTTPLGVEALGKPNPAPNHD